MRRTIHCKRVTHSSGCSSGCVTLSQCVSHIRFSIGTLKTDVLQFLPGIVFFFLCWRKDCWSWIDSSVSVNVRGTESAKEERVSVRGLVFFSIVIWGPQHFSASVFNFGAKPPHGSRLDIAAASPLFPFTVLFSLSPSFLYYVCQLYPLFFLPLSVTHPGVTLFFHSSHSVSSVSFRLLYLPLITRAAIRPRTASVHNTENFQKQEPLVDAVH